MPAAYGNIKTLIPGKNDKGIILRLIRRYDLPDFYGGKRPLALECVFHDNEGVRIHATIGQMHMDKFRDILKEGCVYSVVEFVVGTNKMKIKTTMGKHKLLIFKCTRIFEIIREDFPNCMFEFKAFNEVATMENNAPTFDVIAIVVCSYNPQMINCTGKAKKMMKVVLEDIEGRTMRCTLWEKFAEQMLDFIQTGPESPPGIILHFCTTNIFGVEVEIQNCFDTTKIYLDQEMAEIKEYKAKYLSTNGKGTMASVSTLTTPGSSGKAIIDEHRDGELQLKTLSEIQKDGQLGVFLVYATVVCVENAKDWAYNACKNCRKKLQEAGQSFICNKCGIDDAKAILRYKLIVRVVDDTDTALFLLWDKESVGLIGKNAADIPQSAELHVLPAEIDGAMANKSALFKVNVMQEDKASEMVYPVLRLESDREIIAQVLRSNSEMAETGTFSKLDEQDEKTEEMVGSSSTSFSTPIQQHLTVDNQVDKNEVAMVSKTLFDEFSSSMPKKRLKRLKQEK